MKYILILIFSFYYLQAQDITIRISFGGDKPDKIIETNYNKGDTALEVLSKAVKITIAKGKYKFVRSIEGKKSIPGTYGWFYLIDGKSPGKMASIYQLKDALSMTWYYKVEDCY